ncbi:MAG TPA: ATP-binding protein [Aquabacterium sp.]|nr:ATP-binding protein [Aquabacterium sp.]
MIATSSSGACAAAPHPEEARRLRALHDLQILDSLAEPMFDDVAELAAQICGTPVALISLVDEHRQWFKAKVGVDVQETPREMAFCAHAILNADAVMVVNNVLEDTRFATNPLVVNDPHIRFYAGAPIVTPDGLPLGTVCAIDRQPRTLDANQLSALQALSRQVARLLNFRRAALDRVDQVEQALRVREEEAQRLMAFAVMDLDLKAFVDRHYRYLAVNGAYQRYWQRESDQIVGRTVAEVRGQALFNATLKPHIDRALAGDASSFETDSLYPGRGLRRMQVRFAPARSAQGDVVGVVIDEHDIQDLAEAAQKLRDTITALEKKTLSQQKFIYMLSHDLREPVNTIINFSGVLRQRLGAEPQADLLRFVDFIHGGGTRLKALLDDLLEYVRLEHQTVRNEPIRLCELVEGVVSDLSDAIERTGAWVDCDARHEVFGDPHLLRVVIQNLIANGIKFVAPGVQPRISVTARETPGAIRLMVQDNGIGIAPEHQHQLFQVFKRLHHRKDYEGVGMGLATCRRIVEMHGGAIGVESQPGQGSTFWFELPQHRGQS